MLHAQRMGARVRARCMSTVQGSGAGGLSLAELAAHVRRGDYEGYAAASLLPSHARTSGFVMRALNIELAGARDAANDNAVTARVRLQFWKSLITAVYEGGNNSHPLFPLLKQAVAQHQHTRRWLDRMVEMRLETVEGKPPVSIEAAEVEAEGMVSPLLYLALEACNARSDAADEAASHIGQAIGLANILRSFAVNSRASRRTLPVELLVKYNLTDSDVWIREEYITFKDGRSLLEVLGAESGAPASKQPVQEMARATTTAATEAPKSRIRAPGPNVTPSAAAQRLSAVGPTSSAAPTSAASTTAAGAATGAGAGTGSRLEALRATLAAEQRGAPPMPAARGGAGPSGSVAPSIVPPEKRVFDAHDLTVAWSDETMRGLRSVVKEIADNANEHLVKARSMHSRLPVQAVPALLPAVPVSRFLDQLAAADYNVLAQGLGPWVDPRRFGRLYLHLDLLKHTLRNTY